LLAGFDEVLPEQGGSRLDALGRERVGTDVSPLGPGGQQFAEDAVAGREDLLLQGGG
jgi:hypothetical protein